MKIDSITSFSDLTGTVPMYRLPHWQQDFNSLYQVCDYLHQFVGNGQVLSVYLDNGRYVQVTPRNATIIYNMYFIEKPKK